MHIHAGQADIASFPLRLHLPAQRTAELGISVAGVSKEPSPTQHRKSSRSSQVQQKQQQQHQLPDRPRSSETIGQAPDRPLPQHQSARSLGDWNGRLRPPTPTARDVIEMNRSAAGHHRRSLPTSTTASLLDTDALVVADDNDSSSPEHEGSIAMDRLQPPPSTTCCLVSAWLALDRRAFIVGDEVVTDIAVCNRSDGSVTCSILLQQVSTPAD